MRYEDILITSWLISFFKRPHLKKILVTAIFDFLFSSDADIKCHTNSKLVQIRNN